MIIKKIILENYLCYYDVKELELSNGLNIILGENGEGKTKLFEAVNWLFNGENRNLDSLISSKALSEAEIGDQFRVRVSMHVEQFGEKKIIAKSFIVKKQEGDDFSVSNYMIEGIEENKSGERSIVDGQILLDRIFPYEIRRYSMFKGESELNIFDNEDALTDLINSFSTARHYEKYIKRGEYLSQKADEAVEDDTKLNTKNRQKYNTLDLEINRLQTKKNNLLEYLNSTEEQIKKAKANIQEAEKYVRNGAALDTINARIGKIEEQKKKVEAQIDENYTTCLFDEKWILTNYESIHNAFSKKVNSVSNKRRELQKEFDKQIGIREGKKLVHSELLNNSIPLPIGVPSKAHMAEMIKDEFCKVCNRPAEKDSEPYNFMLKRLDAYLKSQEPINEDVDEVLFQNNYINRLFNLSVNHEDSLGKLRDVKNNIKDQFDFNSKRKQELEELINRLDNEHIEREKIIGQSSIGAERLSNVFKNYNGWQKDLSNYTIDQFNYQQQIDTIDTELNQKRLEKDKLDLNSANTFLIKTRAIIRDVETIFKTTGERKFNEFIDLLQAKSNTIFDKVNTDAFTGVIVFKKKKNNKKEILIEPLLQEENGRMFHKPNQSLVTSMHISILFAISELASEQREEQFPMIFDAPTSSFGETKTAEFLNLIYSTNNQKILLIKDFLALDEITKKLSVKKEFNDVRRDKAFWVRLERPFNRKNLKTLNTEIITL